MDNLLTLVLEAHNDQSNHHRRYEIIVGRDLLGDWTVTICNGRVGARGQQRVYASPKREVLQGIIAERLKRRTSAPNRIGCAYRVKMLDIAESFDPTGWLPIVSLQMFS